MKTVSVKLTLVLLLIATIALAQDTKKESALRARAAKLAHQYIIIDTHIDVPYRLRMVPENISDRTEHGEFDYVRAKQGGLDAPFMSIYTPSEYEKRGGAKALADTLIDMVEQFAKAWPSKFALARTPAEVVAQSRRGLVSLCMGMENGSPIEHDLSNVAYFYNRGIRYITLTHGKDNHISDSSYDTSRVWKGLSFFGRRVVAEMNRVGIMIDISHVSDAAFEEVMNITKAPAIASHSSCRAFTPGFERNMSDDMIRKLAAQGGVIMINFGSSFLSSEYNKREDEGQKEVMAYLRSKNLSFNDPEARAYIETYRKEHAMPPVSVTDVADHIDHVIELVGVEYVGLGSDFDGVGDSLPIGLRDVSQYPNLIYELFKRGYSDTDIQKICGENLLRVWRQVEQRAKELSAQTNQ